MSLLVVEDLFVVGIALDIFGAYVLAHGLLASNVEIARRAAGFWGTSPPDALAYTVSKVDGYAGLGTLALGFALQAVGYTLTLGRGGGQSASARQAAAALVLGTLTVAVAYLLWRSLRRRLVLRTLAEVARVNVHTKPVRVEELPYGGPLVGFGEAAGYPRRDGESERDYAQRVFGVEKVEPGHPERDPD